ncbi:MAG: hypothetical protein IJZ83_07935 [Clostridia bacterium]|nr:hypothetical protein [Clostridia bacterium]
MKYVSQDYITYLPSGERNCAQGACTDGEYIYVSLLKIIDYSAGEFDTVLQKLDMQGNVKMTSASLPLAHCNDLCYNTKTREIVAVTMDHSRLEIIDPDTLTIKQTVTFEGGGTPYAISYDAQRDVYILLANGYFNVLNSDFEIIQKAYRYVDGNYTAQGLHYSGEYVYMPMSAKTSAGTDGNVILVFDLNFNHLYTVTVEDAKDEIETLITIDGELYAVYNSKNPSGSGGLIKKLTLQEA